MTDFWGKSPYLQLPTPTFSWYPSLHLLVSVHYQLLCPEKDLCLDFYLLCLLLWNTGDCCFGRYLGLQLIASRNDENNYIHILNILRNPVNATNVKSFVISHSLNFFKKRLKCCKKAKNWIVGPSLRQSTLDCTTYSTAFVTLLLT